MSYEQLIVLDLLTISIFNKIGYGNRNWFDRLMTHASHFASCLRYRVIIDICEIAEICMIFTRTVMVLSSFILKSMISHTD